MSKFTIDFEGTVETTVPGNLETDMKKMGKRVHDVIDMALREHFGAVPMITEVGTHIIITNHMSILGDFK